MEDKLSNMSLYDAKKYFRRAQNVVFNYTEMEAKVREATNNEPWGASSTLMEQIAQGTYNLREREEVIGMIFRRFTEKTATEWRQIYKALQLLDYLIRHGSERFIDDTRSSISLIKMLESFHFIDSQGRDQGINVRNRAKALAELLSNDERIRSERKKARETAKKYKGVAGGSAAGKGALNANAGFKSTRAYGISVSADSDDDEGEEESPAPSSFKDQLSKEQATTGSDDLFSFHDNANEVGDLSSTPQNEDEDDEFADFQSALPAVHSSTPSLPSQVNNIYGSSNAFTSARLPSVVPAISSENGKSDPFSSLFSSAKKSSSSVEQLKAVTKLKDPSSAESAKTEVEDEDEEDVFGEMTAADASQKPKEKNPAHTGEIDLLSF